MPLTFQIRTGPPCGNTPASFTRFVLPFAYHLHRTTEHPEHRFESCCPTEWGNEGCDTETFILDKATREEYLTRETSAVLFKRAKWFRSNQIKPREEITLSSGLTIQISSPGVVLFELDPCIESSSASLLQTGFLVFEIGFTAESKASLVDILTLNEVLRYWKLPFEAYPRKQISAFGMHSVCDLLKKANRVDADQPFLCWQEALRLPIKISEKQFYYLTSSKAVKESVFAPDNRAYVWTCAIHWDGAAPEIASDGSKDYAGNQLLNSMAEGFDGGPLSPPSSACSPWVKLLNVDLPTNSESITQKETAFENDWVAERTYRRWAKAGALYGFSNHSGAMLSGPLNEPPTWQHFRQLYFDQALLMLYVQTTIFRFSERLTELTAEAAKADSTGDQSVLQKLIEPFDKLRLDFTIFTNLYQFPLVSKQQQGLEMYVLLRKQMDVQELFDEVKSEIESTQELLNAKEEKKQARAAETLNLIALAGLVLGLTLAFFGMEGELLNALGLRDQTAASLIIYLLVTIFGLAALSYWFWNHRANRNKPKTDD